MTPEELQTAYDNLTAAHADLQARFDQVAPLILEIRKELATAKADLAAAIVQRDTYKRGFDTQSAAHAAAATRLDRLMKGLPVSAEPLPAEPVPVVDPTPAP